MKKLNVFKKLCSITLALAMLISMIPTNVFAAGEDTTLKDSVIDTSKSGSLTINKLDSVTQGAIKGVEFTIYQVIEIVEGTNGEVEYKIAEQFQSAFNLYTDDSNPITVEKLQQMSDSELKTFVKYLDQYVNTHTTQDNTITLTQQGVTDSTGKIKFDNLKLGFYLVRETKTPNTVSSPAAAFLVSIPMTVETTDEDNVTSTYWEYNVEASPKNVTSTTDGLTLTKYANSIDYANTLEGAHFKLEKASIMNDSLSWTVVEEDLTTNSNGEISVDGLEQGTYRFVETKAPEGYILDTTKTYEFTVKWDANLQTLVYTYNEETSETLNIAVINEQPTINKEVDKKDVSIGDTVKWTVTTTVPESIQHLKTFTVTDVLSKGLTWDETNANLTVKQGDKTLELDKDYTLKVTKDEAGTTLELAFVGKNLTPSTDLSIEYQTTVNSNAVIGTDGNPNNAKLTYSTVTTIGTVESPENPDNPGDDNDTPENPEETDVVEERVYTYGLTIYKYNKSNEALAGAVFALQDTGGNPVKDQDGNDIILTSGEDGLASHAGLKAGDYQLVETKAPAGGYNLLKEPIKFSITPTYNEDGTLNKVEASPFELIDGGYIKVEVLNLTGFELPTTGGMGTVIFTVGGLALMAVAGGAYVIMKRKDSNQ